jgi:energy-coupling factor transport system permease protein
VLLLLALLGMVYLAHTPLRYALQGLRPALPWITIFAVLQLLFYRDQYGSEVCSVVWRGGFVTVTTCGLRQIGLMALRLLEFMILISLLTLTSTTTQLTPGALEVPGSRVVAGLRHRAPLRSYAGGRTGEDHEGSGLARR